MTCKHPLLFTGLVAGSLVAFSALSAQASQLATGADANAAGCAGLVTCSVNGFDFSVNAPGGSKLTIKSGLGLQTIGISPDGTTMEPSTGEIDVGEVLDVGFDTATVDYIDLGFLYQPGVFFDDIFEVVEISSSAGTGTLTITGDTTADWEFGGNVFAAQNLSPSLPGNQGLYRILNPFGTNIVSGVTLTPVQLLTGGTNDSDFGFAAIKVTPAAVPEPGTTAALLGIGALATGLGVQRKRRNKA